MTTRTYPTVLLAGQSASDLPLTSATGVTRKALLPIAGQPMIGYVLRALVASGRVSSLAIVGLAAGGLPGISGAPLVVYLPDLGSAIANALSAINALGDAPRVLFCSCDIPLLTPIAVADLLDRCEASGAELCYPVVTREVMEARFPGSGRSYRHLVDGEFAGGDLFLVAPHVLRRNAELAKRLSNNRKTAWGLARLLGPGVLLRFALRRLRVADLERRAGRALGCTCRAIVSPYPETAMDVDKPHHLRVVERAMGGRPSP